MIGTLANRGMEQTVKSLDGSIETLSNTLIERTADLDRSMSARQGELNEKLDEHVASMELTLGTRLDSVGGTLEAAADTVGMMLDERGARLAETLQTNVAGIGDALTAEADRAESKMANAVASLEKRVREQLEAADSAIGSRADAVTSVLAERTAELNVTLAARSRELSQLLTRDTLPLLQNFESQGKAVADQLAASTSEIAIGLTQRLEGTSHLLRGAADQAAEKLASSILQSNERMEEAAQAAADDLGTRYSALETRTGDLVTRLTRSSEQLSSVVDNQAGSLVRSGEELSERLASVASQVGDRVRAESTALVETLSTKSSETVAALNGTNERLKSEIGTLLEQLNGSNRVLASLITSADQNLASAQTSLAEQAETFKTVAEQAAGDLNTSNRIIETNYKGLRDISGTVLNDVAAITARFEDQSKALGSVASLLGDTQDNLASNLDNRREAIEQLTEGLVIKSGEIEKLMLRFTGLMEGSVANAETRADTLGKDLASKVDSAAREATERFAEATQEMRGSAETLRSELSATRGELKKTVIDLPEETKESATAMRRVVSDQIKALKDLSDLVAKSKRLYDAPTSSDAPRQRVAQPEPVAETRAPSPEPVAPSPAPAPIMPVASAPAPVTQPTVAPATLRGSFGPVEKAASDGAKSGDGWVSDLLRRASADDDSEQPAPARSASSDDAVGSLSADIAAAIEHDTAVSLWQRYQRGDQNVFSRDMYTRRGQQTFDEIKSKYRDDTSFKGSVDRYIADFEKLIADVARNDRDNIMTQTYLTSDTGKVYTMLAHAAGRFSA